MKTSVKEYIRKHSWLEMKILSMLMPAGQSRPRKWVKWFILPFIIRKGKGTVIRPRTRIDVFPFNRFNIGHSSTIEDFCTINNVSGNVLIGNRTRIGFGSVVIGPVHIGDDVKLAQNVVITALNHNYEDVERPILEQGLYTKQIYIGDETCLGANSVVLPGIFIGKHCIVAAGSIVTKNIPSYSVVAGNPARIIKQFNPTTGKWEKLPDLT
jgi:acetyltransferase-like isoleucine patch superfamily enzyme